MTIDIEKIKQKIKNLLARDVEHGATPEEASVCLAKAQKLLEEYNLDIAEILNYDKEAIKEDEVQIAYGIARMPEFKIFINRLAKVYNSTVITHSRRLPNQRYYSTYYTFAGTVINTEYCKYMLQVVLDILENSWKNYKKTQEYEANLTFYGKPRRIQNSFYRGFLLKVSDTCFDLITQKERELHRQKENSPEGHNSYKLMVLNTDKVNEYLSKIGIVTSRISTKNFGKGENFSAKHSGHQAGSSVSFGKPVEGQANKLLA